MKPGEVLVRNEFIALNEGQETKAIKVCNMGDRPIQVGSHFHFYEINKFMKFDRKETYGFRLDIPSGTAVRFEPGEEKEVELVKIAGRQRIIGLNHLTDAQINETTKQQAVSRAKLKGF